MGRGIGSGWSGLLLFGSACHEPASVEATRDTDTSVTGDPDPEPDPDPDPDLPAERLALVYLSDATDPPKVVAFFYAFDLPTTAPAGAGTTFGDCTVTLGAPVDSEPSYTLIEPGAVVATLDGSDIGMVGSGRSYTGTLSGWPTDAVLGYSVSGDEFPTFSVANFLTVPSFVELVDAPYEADRTSDLVIRWIPGNAELRLSLGAVDARVDCAFDDAAGVGTVPLAALALLPVGSIDLDIYRYAHAERVLAGAERVVGEAIPHNPWQAKLR